MNKDTINRTIAEACGWKPCTKGCDGKTWRYPDDSGCTDTLPAYTDCLNAMNAAEVWLRGTDEEYRNDPVRYIRWNTYQDYLIRKFGISASAKNRADTFVKVIGKWETPTGEENE